MVYLSMIHTKMSNVVTGFDWIWMGLVVFNGWCYLVLLGVDRCK